MLERLEVGYIAIDPDPDPEKYTDTITITRSKPAEEDNRDAADRQQDRS